MAEEIQLQGAEPTEAIPQDRVKLSSNAAARVRMLIEREGRPDGAGLKLGVVGGGCSGMQYTLELADGPAGEEQTFDEHGVSIFVDDLSLPYLAGTLVDYVDGLHGAGFKFVNPNADRTCGCGSSFSV